MAAKRKAVSPVKVGTIGKTASNNQANNTRPVSFFQLWLSTITCLANAMVLVQYLLYWAILFVGGRL
jgi:hypothetical protein